MSRIKYGIDLGTTNSAIAEISKGVSLIIKNQLQKDTTPSCIGFSKKKGVLSGDRAYNQLKGDKKRALMTGKDQGSNFFLEFKRTMGTDQKYHSDNMGKNYSSEELSSEVLKSLQSQVQESIKSVVITIPAMFNDNQKTATIDAANLAGFSQVELLQEPIAAATAFGVDEQAKDGNILVFDFGGGTFDVCLISIEDGIMQVKDTGGDVWLGGKNLDEAIIDKIILPWVKQNFKIDSYLNDDKKSTALNNSLKIFAENIKIAMSFEDSYSVISELDEFPDDDEGNEIELEFEVSNDDMKSAVGPVFQQAIDLTLELLKRNKLKGSDLSSLILVGGPTFSPILREMIKEQVCIPNTKVDPMTVVARGAAIYASKFDISEEIKDEVRDETKIQLDISYESQTVEPEEELAIKINIEKTKGDLPDKALVIIKRLDGGWESPKTELPLDDTIICPLLEGRSNNFEIIIVNNLGDTIDCEPSEFTIMQGVKPGEATMAYNYGIEILDDNGKPIFKTITGLGKNSTLPATGDMSGLKTQQEIRPGTDDGILIPIYMGEDGADGTRASSHTHVHTAKIKANDLPKLLPVNSEVNIFLEIIADGKYNLSVDIPYLNETYDIPLEKQSQKGESNEWFEEQFKSFLDEISTLKSANKTYDIEKLNKIENELNNIKSNFESRKNDGDTRRMTRDNIRKQFASLDKLINESSWPSALKEMEEMYYQCEKKINEIEDNSNQKTQLNRFKSQMTIVIENKNLQQAKDLHDEMHDYHIDLLDAIHGVKYYIAILAYYHQNFSSQPWKDSNKARVIIDTGLKVSMVNPTKDQIKNYCQEVWQLLPSPDKPEGRKDILGQ